MPVYRCDDCQYIAEAKKYQEINVELGRMGIVLVDGILYVKDRAVYAMGQEKLQFRLDEVLDDYFELELEELEEEPEEEEPFPFGQPPKENE